LPEPEGVTAHHVDRESIALRGGVVHRSVSFVVGWAAACT
jgi:hypothetical protein